MTLPKNARLLRTGELPPIGSRVYVPENTAAFAGSRPAPGWQTVLDTVDTHGTVAVKDAEGYNSWVLSHNLLVEDEAPEPALVSVRHEVTVTIERPATAGQLAAGAAAIDPDWPVTVHVHPDRIEFYAHHEEPRG